jgi:AraC-like DNA-binding protein
MVSVDQRDQPDRLDQVDQVDRQDPQQTMVRGRPAAALAPYVGSYTGYRYAGLAPGFHQGLPSGNVTFIVSLAGPIEMVAMPGDQAPLALDAFVGGLHLAPATLVHDGSGAGISIELSPLGSRALFGLPAAPLASLVVDLRDLLGRAGHELVDRLNAAVGWPARFAILDAVLGRALASGTRAPGPPEVERAWHLLAASGGRMAVADLATEVGWSRRHLASRFASELGVSPKGAARLLRFERTCALLDRGLGLAAAAAVGGYYDQSHMTAEWHDLAGSTPARWHDDELRDRHHDVDPDLDPDRR